MAKAMIPGGETERVANQGGQDLFVTLAMAMGGHSVEVCVYALTSCLANVGLAAERLDQASELMRAMAEDAVNQLELNWPDRDKLLSEAIANTHTVAGNG